MRIRTRVSLAIAGFALASASVAAHHSFAMFEMDKDVDYRGVVSEWKWQNPHVHFTIDIKQGSGVDPKQVGRWDVEGASINIMTRQGWTRASYKIGDPIRVVGHPMKDGSKGISLFYAIGGFAVNATTGTLFLIMQPHLYLTSGVWWSKFTFIIIAGLNAAFFETRLAKPALALDANADMPRGLKIAGAVSLFSWFAVLYCGRMVPYLGTGN